MKLKFMILLMLGFTMLSSCSKDNEENKTTCYECKLALEAKENGVIKSFNNSTEDVCNKSESEIKKLEEDNTYTKTENGIVTTSKYKCNLKK